MCVCLSSVILCCRPCQSFVQTCFETLRFRVQLSQLQVVCIHIAMMHGENVVSCGVACADHVHALALAGCGDHALCQNVCAICDFWHVALRSAIASVAYLKARRLHAWRWAHYHRRQRRGNTSRMYELDCVCLCPCVCSSVRACVYIRSPSKCQVDGSTTFMNESAARAFNLADCKKGFEWVIIAKIAYKAYS